MEVREILTQRVPRHVHAAGAACGAPAKSRDALSREKRAGFENGSDVRNMLFEIPKNSYT